MQGRPPVFKMRRMAVSDLPAMRARKPGKSFHCARVASASWNSATAFASAPRRSSGQVKANVANSRTSS